MPDPWLTVSPKKKPESISPARDRSSHPQIQLCTEARGPNQPQPKAKSKPKDPQLKVERPLSASASKTLARSPRIRNMKTHTTSPILASTNLPFVLPPICPESEVIEEGNKKSERQLRRRSNSFDNLTTTIATETPSSPLRTWKRRQLSLKIEKPPLVRRTSSIMLSKLPEVEYELPQDPTARQRVVHEIIQTEADYLRDIEILVALYIKPLRGESSKGKTKGILNKKQNRIIFSNIELLFNLNIRFFESLSEEAKKPDDEQLIGNCFLQVGQFLKMYSEYCSNQTTALRYVSLARGTKEPNPSDNFEMSKEQISEFSSFCDYSQTRPESRKLDLPSFLIKPVQRVCKYPLLLREMIKSTETSHKDHLLLQKAFDMISETVHQIDQSKNEIENMKYFEEIHETYKVNLIAGGRHYLHTGPAWIRKDAQKFKKGKFFIFTDLFAFGKGTKIHLISLKDALIIGKPKTEIEGVTLYALEIRLIDKRMEVGFETLEELNKVTQILFDQVESLIPGLNSKKGAGYATMRRK